MHNFKKELSKARAALTKDMGAMAKDMDSMAKDMSSIAKDVQSKAKDLNLPTDKEKLMEVLSFKKEVPESQPERENSNRTPSPEPPRPSRSPSPAEETVNMGSIEEQLEKERALRAKKAELESKSAAQPQGSHDRTGSSMSHEEPSPRHEEKQEELVTTVASGIAELSEEDQPRFSLYSSKSVMMTRDEGFIFCVDVNAGYFRITIENSQRSALETLTKLGQEPTLYVRVRVVDPRPWSQMFVKNFTLRSQRDSRLDWVFSVNRSSTLQIIVVHNGALQATGMMKTSYMAINVMSCFAPDFVTFHRGNGVKKTHEVQERMDATDSIKPQFIDPVPQQLAQQLLTKHSFTATGVGEDVIIFGGCRTDGTITNQLMMLDACTNKLGEFGDLFSSKLVAGGNKFVYTGLVPPPRAGHSACVYAGKIIYFAGFDARKDTLSDMHFFHIVDRAWSSPDALRSIPVDKDPALCTLGRGFHSAVVHESHMYVYGGCSDFDAAIAQKYYHTIIPASVLWRYDFQDRVWTDLTPSIKGPIPHNNGQVYGHCAAVVGDGMFVCGGAEMALYTGQPMQGSHSHSRHGVTRCDEVYHFSFSQLIWTTYKTTGLGPLSFPFASMWGMDSQPSPELRESWPTPQLRAKPNNFEKRLARFKALMVFGGQGKVPTCDAIYVLPLQQFRNHPKLEWFSIDTDTGINDESDVLIPEILRDCEADKKDNFSELMNSVAYMPKAWMNAMTAADKDKALCRKDALAAFVRIPRTMFIDVPRAALIDLPREVLYELPKAAIENLKDDEDVEPDPPGAHTIVRTEGRLQLMTFGVRVPQPDKEEAKEKDKDKSKPADHHKDKERAAGKNGEAELPPIFLLPDIIPQDFIGEFSTCAASSNKHDMQEDVIAKTFSEYEQSVATLRAQIQVAQRLSTAEPRCDYKDAFIDATADLKKLIKRCNKLLLMLPPDAFGGKGKDLMELFQVLQLQAQGLAEAAEAEEEKEEEEEEVPDVSPANGDKHGHRGGRPWSRRVFGPSKKRHESHEEKLESHPSNSSIKAPHDPAPAPHALPDHPKEQTPAPAPAPVSVLAAPPTPSVPSQQCQVTTSTAATTTATTPAAPGGRPAIDFEGLPREVRQFVELVDSIESQLTCVESYSTAVKSGQVEFRSTLQEESDMLLTYIKGAQDKVNDVPANIYSTEAGRAQAQQAEAVVNFYYTQLARAEDLLGAEAIRKLPQSQKNRGEKSWQKRASPPSSLNASHLHAPSTSYSHARAASQPLPGTPKFQSTASSATEESPSASSTASTHSLPCSIGNGMDLTLKPELLDRSSHAVEWRSRFSLPADESLLNNFACALKGTFGQGRLYVSKNHICFHGGIGHSSKVIALLDIANIQKKASAGFINNAIEVNLRDGQRLVFTNLVSRDAAYQLIFSLWQSALLMS